MKKRSFLSLCAAAVLSGSLTPAFAQETISIGAILPLTGPSATVGEDIRRGIQAGVDQVNAQGGVLGKKLTSSSRIQATTRPRR